MKIKALSYFFIAVAALQLIGCTTYNAATGRREFIYISTTEEISMGKEIHKSISEKEKIAEKGDQLKRIKTIGAKLAQVSDRQDYVHEFYIVEKDELNAFTTPGGKIYIYIGLIDKLDTDDQVASVLAHEIGHGAARHTVKKFQAALGYNLVGAIILNQLDVKDETKQVAALSSNVLMGIVFSSYGRKDEYEADRLGIKYMYLAGYDINGSIEALEVLKKESKGPEAPLILKSHPHLEDRITAAKMEIQAIQEKYGPAGAD